MAFYNTQAIAHMFKIYNTRNVYRVGLLPIQNFFVSFTQLIFNKINHFIRSIILCTTLCARMLIELPNTPGSVCSPALRVWTKSARTPTALSKLSRVIVQPRIGLKFISDFPPCVLPGFGTLYYGRELIAQTDYKFKTIEGVLTEDMRNVVLRRRSVSLHVAQFRLRSTGLAPRCSMSSAVSPTTTKSILASIGPQMGRALLDPSFDYAWRCPSSSMGRRTWRFFVRVPRRTPLNLFNFYSIVLF